MWTMAMIVFGSGLLGGGIAILACRINNRKWQKIIDDFRLENEKTRLELAKRREARWTANGGRTLHNITRSK